MPGCEVRSENTQTFPDYPGRHADVLIAAPGRSPVVVEAEYEPAAEVERDASERLGLRVQGQPGTVEAAIAVRYPQVVEDAYDVRQVLSEVRLSYHVLHQDGTRFPESGWLEGSATDLADLARLVSAPHKAVEQAADTLEQGIGQAATRLDEMAKLRPNVTLVIARLLGMSDVPQTRRMACAIIANAMVFHQRIAGMHQGVKPLRLVCGPNVANPQSEALAAWDDILKINYWPIFAIAKDILEQLPGDVATGVLRELLETAQEAASGGATSVNSTGLLLARAWQAGAGPGDGPLTIDLDSTICETYGLAKEGARHHGYTGKRGYHPLLAVAAGTGDVLMSRLREGRANTARGAAHFLRETVSRVRRAGASGQLTARADSGFYAHALVAACREMDVRFSITIRQHKSLRNLIEAIPDADWTPVPYWMDGAADVAQTTYTPFRTEPGAAPVRLIVRRVKPTPGSQLALFATYSYHGFITDRDGETLELEADHRRHAEIENAIRDLKYGVGLNHMPSGRFAANGAWLAVQVMAHNLARWTARIGLGEQIATTKTLRRRFFSLAGRLTRSARRLTLHLPQRWPWETQFSRALARLRAIPLPA